MVCEEKHATEILTLYFIFIPLYLAHINGHVPFLALNVAKYNTIDLIMSIQTEVHQ